MQRQNNNHLLTNPGANPPNPLPAANDSAWEALLLAIDNPTHTPPDHLGDRLAADPEFRRDFADATLLLETLRLCNFSTPMILSSGRPTLNPRRRPAVMFAIGSLVAASLAVCSLPAELRTNHESLKDAVAVSSLLRNSESMPDPTADTDSWLDQPASSLETPNWLLTAIDLSEQAPPEDDQDEAIF
jgi:hypothetical protein